MNAQWLALFQSLSLLSMLIGLQILLILALRIPVRKRFGAAAAYRLWALPLVWLPVYLLWPLLPALPASPAELTGLAAATNGTELSSALPLRQWFAPDLPLPPLPTFDPGDKEQTGVWQILIVVWLTVTVGLWCNLGLRLVSFARHLRRQATRHADFCLQGLAMDVAEPARVPVLTLPELQCAAVYGVFRPVLLLPDSFASRYDADQRHIILSHEAVHLVRRDNLWNLCASLLLTVFWWNPLLHVAWHCFRFDQELSCDALALARCSGPQRKRYARTLLDSLGGSGGINRQPALSNWHQFRDIKERSLMIKLHLNTRVRPGASRLLLYLLGLGGTAFTQLAGAWLVAASAATGLYLLPAATSVAFDAAIPGTAAQAAEECAGGERNCRRLPPAARESQALTRPVYDRIEKVMALRDMEDYAGARLVLDEIKELYDRGRLNDFEKYTMWQFYAGLEQAQENFAPAIAYYQEILQLENLTQERLEQTWFYIGSLYFALEDYRQSVAALNTYNEIAIEPNDDVYLRIAMAYYQLEENQNAVPAVLRNMELLRAKGESVPESTYSLLRALYFALEDYENARQISREMVVLFNPPDDWSLLAAINGQLERFTEQGHTYWVANAGGYLDSETEFTNLASQLYNNDNPWGCARILEQGMADGIIEEDEENLSFLAMCYQIAREDEKAAPLLERAAAMADDGELYSRLARVYMTIGKFEESIGAFDSAFETGGLNRPDQTYLSQSRAFLELNRYDEAIAAARNAQRDERSAETARTMIQYLNGEKARHEALQLQRTELARWFR